MLAALVVAFVLGALFSLLVAASAWLFTAPLAAREDPDHVPGFRSASMPEPLRAALCSEDQEVAVESCRWFNLIIAFLFQELRDSPRVKSFIMGKIHKEFRELMFTRKEGRMLEQLTVRDYDWGSSLPLFTHAVIQQVKWSDSDPGELEEVDISVHVDYSGGCRIGVDADLVFNRVAYVAIHVMKVKGHGRLQFTTQPCTHWSFAFYEEPELTVEVESTFEGRSFPQLSSFIEAQLRRWVRQKHTLPAHKTRFKPFFLKPKPQSQLNELYVHNKRVTEGRLYVEVVKCSRLLHPPSATATYCTLNTSLLPWQPVMGVWRSRWAEHEFSLRAREPSVTIGIRYRLVEEGGGGQEERSEFVIIFEVLEDSVAAHAGVRKGDVIVRVNNVRVRSVGQVKKVINKTKRSSILLAVKRPPKHISEHMLNEASPALLFPPTSKTSDGEGGDCVRGEEGDGDTASLYGVGGERSRHHDNGQGSDAVSLDGRLSASEATPHMTPTTLPRETRNVDEEGAVKQTEAVEVCQAPRWRRRRKFRFSVGPQHHYLNVCVYDRLASEERGEILIGHVTVPLMDVALECLASRAGWHQQKYVLVAPGSARASASRTVLQASGEGAGKTKGRRRGEKGEEGQQFVGSIQLRFRHSTQRSRRGEGKGLSGETQLPQNQEDDPVQSGQQPAGHQFRSVELEGAQRCHICHKRIWALKGRVQVCARCGIQCHKRCVANCHRAVACRRGIELQSHDVQGFTVYEDAGQEEGDGEMGRGECEWAEHRRHRQSSEDGFVNVPDMDADYIRVDGEAGESEGSLGKPAEAEGEAGDSSDGEDLQRLSEEEKEEHFTTPSSSSGGESGQEEAERMLAELGYRMFSHLPECQTECQRAAAIHSKVEEMECEVERVQQLVRSTQALLDSGHGNQEALRRQLRQHEEKLQPLQLLRRHYTLALRQMTSDSVTMETGTQ